MRFLFHFYDLEQRAGIQRAICTLSNALVEQGHQVLIAAHSERSRVAFPLDDRVALAPLPYPEYQKSGLAAWPVKAGWAVRQFRVLTDLIHSFKPSLVVDHGTALGLLYPFATLAGVPFVLQRHFAVSSFPHGKVLYRILGRLNASKTVVVLTRGIARDLQQFGYKHVAVIPNVVPPEATPGGPPDTNPRIGLLLGRGNNPQKGFDIFLKAIAAVDTGGWRFVIAGPHVNTDSLLAGLVRELGLRDRVSLLPATDKPYELIRRCTCLIMPSRYEGLPMVALEALSIGRPVIASDTDGLREVIHDGVNGLVFPSENVAALAQCMARVCPNPGILEDLARNAHLQGGDFDRSGIVASWCALAARSDTQ